MFFNTNVCVIENGEVIFSNKNNLKGKGKIMIRKNKLGDKDYIR